MLDFTEQLYDEFQEEIRNVAFETEHEIQKAKQCFHIAERVLQKLKAYMKDHTFLNLAEEVVFFKEIKPQFHRELIFYAELMYIDANKPIGTKKCVLKYYAQKLEEIQAYFDRNHILYTYYRMGRSDQDELLYVRETDCVPLIPDYSLELDPNFSTINSCKLAKIQAFEKVYGYIQQTIVNIEQGTQAIAPPSKPSSLWTDSKSALIELAYALHSCGSINNGKCDVKMIIASLEMMFNVEVGNFYRTFQSMRIRKKNRTIYLDHLKESLEKRMNDTDVGF